MKSSTPSVESATPAASPRRRRPLAAGARVWAAPLLLAIGCSGGITPGTLPPTPSAWAESAAQPVRAVSSAVLDASAVPEALAVADLKSRAIDALKSGDLGQTEAYITRAADLTPDPSLRQAAQWVRAFRERQATFDRQRQASYDEQVAKVGTLLDRDRPEFAAYALFYAAEAYARAPDKDAFRQQTWVRDLIGHAVSLGEQYERDEQWVKALRVYRDLAAIEPTGGVWKGKLNDAIRRVRALALYTPDGYREIQKGEAEDLKEVEAILAAAHPSADAASDAASDVTPSASPPAGDRPGVPGAAERAPGGPTIDLQDPTDPAGRLSPEPAAPLSETGPDADTTDAGKTDADTSEEEAEVFRVDWREQLAGVNVNMLREALRQSERNYYRDVERAEILLGGLRGLRALVTTRGLEAAFPHLGDVRRRDAFVAEIDRLIETLDPAEAALSLTPAAATLRRNISVDATLDRLEMLNARTIQLPTGVLVSEFADGALGGLDDFSGMIWPADVAEFNKATQGEFSGVGIQIKSEAGELLVVSPLEDTPAYNAGIAPGDVITHIDGKTAKGIGINQAVKTITGTTGTTVTLTIRRADSGETRDYPLVRRTIRVESLKGWRHRVGGGWDYLLDEDQKIGYLRLTSFTKETAAELARVVDELGRQEARGLILDLRNNPGGLLTAATEVADLFLPGGLIVSTKTDRGEEQAPAVHATRSRGDLGLPVVVLVNQFSASASEIVSGALKDLQRALIVGERTFGKGSVQMLFPVDRRQAYLKLTTSHYFLAAGGRIHREPDSTQWGVEPDVTVEMTPEQMREIMRTRQELDVLRRADEQTPDQRAADQRAADQRPADERPADERPAGDPLAADPTSGDRPDADPLRRLLDNDPQLSAALLMLRLHLTGTPLLAEAAPR